MVWFTSLIHRLYISACHVVHPASSARRDPTTHVTPVSVLPVVDTAPEAPAPPPSALAAAPQAPRAAPQLNLLTLPDDILCEIVRHVTHSDHDSPAQGSLLVVEERSYKASVALTATCRQLAHYFYNSLDNVCLSSSRVDDDVVHSLARRSAPVLHRLVLRGCMQVTNHGLLSLARHATALRSLDLSFIASITDEGINILCAAAAPRLKKLLLRRCVNIGDRALMAIADCKRMDTLDVSYCPNISDRGVDHLVVGCGPSLRLLALSHDTQLTDRAFRSIGMHCRNLIQFCARGLPAVSDIGFNDLCRGLGDSIEGIDITDCTSITRDATLQSLRTHCKKIYAHVMPKFASRTLRQILVSTLRQNIFIVHGSDPTSGRDTVHTVLIDNGDIVSASLLSSGTTDLSMLGIVLCKSYGSGLDENTKRMLEEEYGIPTSSLAD